MFDETDENLTVSEYLQDKWHPEITKAVRKNLSILDDSNLFKNTKLPVQVPYAEQTPWVLTEGEGYNPKIFSEKPGFFEQLGHAFKSENEFFALGNMGDPETQNINPLQDEELSEKPDWQQILIDSGVSNPRWFNYIMKGTTRADIDNRIAFAQQREQQENYFAEGSGIADFLGGSAGVLLSPSSLIPISASVKYAKLGKNVLQNTLRSLPGVALQSAGHAALVDMASDTKDMSNYLQDVAIDTIWGSVFIGAGAGFVSGTKAKDIYSARKLAKQSEDSITIKQKIGPKGEFQGLQAEAMKGESVSADVVDKWQTLLDSQIAKKGAFKYAISQKLFSKGNPIVKGLTSSYASVANFFNRAIDHSFVTEGMEKGGVRQTNVEELVKENQAKTHMLNFQIDGLFLEANGIDPTRRWTAEAKKQFLKATNKDMITRKEFDKMVGDVVINPEAQSHLQPVNEAANLVNERFEELYKAYLKHTGISEEIFPPRTAKGYLMRMYDNNYIAASEAMGNKSFVDVVASALKEQDDLIDVHSAGVKQAELDLDVLKNEKKKLIDADKWDEAAHTKLNKQIEQAKSRVLDENNKLRKEMLDNPDLHLVLDTRAYLTSAEEKELEGLLTPRMELEQKVGELQSQLKSEKTSRASILKELEKATEEAKGLELKQEELEAKDNIRAIQEELSSVKQELDDLVFTLEQSATQGKINSKFYTHNKESGRITFRDIHAPVRFRDKIENNDYRGAAERFQQTIQNYNPEQMAQAILSNYGDAATNPLQERSLMIPDSVLRDNNFLITDIAKLTQVYTKSISSRTAIAQVFNDPIFGKGLEGVGNALRQEYIEKKQKIIDSDMPQAKKEKALVKEMREFKKNRDLIGQVSEIMLGTTNRNSKLRTFTNNLRNYTMATRLGAMQLSSLSDTGGIIMKQGLWSYLSEGLAPIMKEAFKKAKNGDVNLAKENAAHAYLGLEHVKGAYGDTAYNPSTMDSVYIGGKVSTAIDNITHVSMNLFGQTYIDNLNQRIVANIAQSKFMRYMEKYREGTLKSHELETLKFAGLSPEVWHERFIEQFEKYGGEKFGAARQTRYFDWQDTEAMQAMVRGIRRSVNESVLKSGWMDAPLFTNDPFAQMIFLFHKWGFSAMSRWVLPAMQREDAHKLAGIVSMMGLGAMVDPLRKFTRGEGFEWDEDAAFLNAFSNSSLGGWYWDGIENLNALFNFSLLPNTNDRRRQLTVAGILGGAPAGLLQDGATIIGGLLNQDTTKGDAKKAIGLLPMSSVWYLRSLVNDFTDNLTLPERRPPRNGIWANY